MRTAAVLSLALLAVTAQAAAKHSSIVQNEYAFVRATAKLGIRDGFLQYFDKQAITFAPQPVNGYDLYTKRKPGGTTKLDWYPSFALMSASGDFGVDTGPWIARWVEAGKPQEAYGEWLSIWHRNAAGQWKALFDAGVGHDKPAQPVQALAEEGKVDQLPAVAGPAPAVQDVRDDVTRAEEVFSNTVITRGSQAAYTAYAVSDLHLLQDGKLPLVGLPAVVQAVSATPTDIQYASMGGSTAASGDLGYVYGMTYKVDDKDHKSPIATYMHVWMRDKDGWRLVVAEEQPLPPPGK
jgi:ketosteroid isomerase-like protein